MSLLYFPAQASSSSAGGALTFISKSTASSSASLEFTSGLDSTYQAYKFVFDGIKASANTTFFGWQARTDGGTTYGVNVQSAIFENWNGSTTGFTNNTSNDNSDDTNQVLMTGYVGSASANNAGGELNFYTPSSTSLYKMFWSVTSFFDDWVDGANQWRSGGWLKESSAVDAVKFYFSSGNITSGNITLYGLKQS